MPELESREALAAADEKTDETSMESPRLTVVVVDSVVVVVVVVVVVEEEV